MGCDIHLHVEVNIDGKWEHFHAPFIWRNYTLFAMMADVRNYEHIDPISKPRGFPEDISYISRKHFEMYERDYHSASWLSGEEYRKLANQYSEMVRKEGNERYMGFELEEMKMDISIFDYKDLRLVFWFDN